jgi:DNA-binding transcriptional ArsR family regulator
MDRTLLARQAEICKVLGNAKRLELLHLLHDGERAVADLQQATELPQTTVSQHLARLRTVGVVRTRNQGTNVFYALTDPRTLQACDLIGDVLAGHLADESELATRINGAGAHAAKRL